MRPTKRSVFPMRGHTRECHSPDSRSRQGIVFVSTRGYESFTAGDAARHNARTGSKAAGVPHKARSKYGAVKETVHGRTFDSKREAAYYLELLAREAAGEVRLIDPQPVYPLIVAGVEIGEYRADFAFEEQVEGRWQRRVVDVKGVKTAVYQLKKKIVEAYYGVTIVEVR